MLKLAKRIRTVQGLACLDRDLNFGLLMRLGPPFG